MAQPTLISTVAELDRALAASDRTPVLLFKHSRWCPVSASAREELRLFLEERAEGDGVLYLLLEVQDAPAVSDAVADRTGVPHETPQALLVRDGRVVWAACHWDLSESAFRAALAAHGLA